MTRSLDIPLMAMIKKVDPEFNTAERRRVTEYEFNKRKFTTMQPGNRGAYRLDYDEFDVVTDFDDDEFANVARQNQIQNGFD